MRPATDFARDHVLFGLCAGVLALSQLLGGGAAAGAYVGDAVLQLVAVPCLIFALWRLAGSAHSALWRAELWLAAAIAALPLLQLVPLPPAIWQFLAFSSERGTSLSLADGAGMWMPLSLTPKATLLSALSLIPPLAVFLAAIQLTRHDRRNLSLVLLACAIASAFIGLLQTAHLAPAFLPQGADAVGLFANRNHFAALLYTSILLAAVWALDNTLSWTTASEESRPDAPTSVYAAVSFGLLSALIAAQLLARSRSGLVLTIFALVCVLVLAYADQRRTAFARSATFVSAAVAAIFVFSLQFALYRMLERFGTDPLQDARFAIAANSWTALKATLPLGSGLGSFVPVYASFESANEALVDKYVNHAHNDFLELLIETGAGGALVLAAFGYWFAKRAYRAWFDASRRGLELDRSLVRGATLALMLLLIHAAVEYHLRTAALMVTFAYLCALLVEAKPDPHHHGVPSPAATARTLGAHEKSGADIPSAAVRQQSPQSGAQSKTSPQGSTSGTQRPAPSPASIAWPSTETGAEKGPEKRSASRDWPETIDWPEQWRKPDRDDSDRS